MAETLTLNEVMVIHQSLMETKTRLEKNAAAIIKEQGRDVYDSIWRDCGTALEKLTSMAKSAMEREAGNVE